MCSLQVGNLAFLQGLYTGSATTSNRSHIRSSTPYHCYCHHRQWTSQSWLAGELQDFAPHLRSSYYPAELVHYRITSITELPHLPYYWWSTNIPPGWWSYKQKCRQYWGNIWWLLGCHFDKFRKWLLVCCRSTKRRFKQQQFQWVTVKRAMRSEEHRR